MLGSIRTKDANSQSDTETGTLSNKEIPANMSLMKEKVGSVGKEEDQHHGASRESASGGSHKHGSKLLLVFLLRLLCPPFPGCKIKPVVGRTAFNCQT